jgi:acyl-CoA synthetase (AMP-forming)/AMP-acid ligase II
LEDPVTETIGEIVRRHGRTAPGAPALVAEGREPMNYGDLVRLMDMVQQRLNTMGFGRGDRIAIVGANGPALAALVTGIWGCATAVPMNPALTAGEFAIYIRDQKVRAVTVDADMDTPARAAAQEIGLPILEVARVDSRVAGMIDIRCPGPKPRPGKTARPGRALLDDLATILTTSGTTSHSKIVPTGHRQLSTMVACYARSLKLTAADRCLNLMPLFHGHGLVVSLGATLYSGGSHVTLPAFSEDAFFRLIETLEPTWYTGSYTFHHTISAAAPNHTAAVEKSRLHLIKTGSGHLEQRIADELEEIFRVPVIETYACTEAGLICSTPLPPAIRKRGTVGLPAGGKVAIIGPDNQFLAPGERGEVVVQGPEVFSGYENDPAANAEAFFDGWFRTGDEGFFDDDGYLTLTGRIKDIINRGGEKITPSEVDDALLSHPAVMDAAAFPIPHPTLGEEVAAVVVLEPDAELDAGDLLAYLGDRLSGFKIPKQMVFAEEIPKSATGKVQRHILAETFGVKIRTK